MSARSGTWLAFAIATTTVVSAQRSPVAPVFSGDSVLQVRLEAPLQTLFSAARKDPNHQVTGNLGYTDERSGREVVVHNVAFEVRGHTSVQPTECTFPKLKAKFAGADGIDGTIF